MSKLKSLSVFASTAALGALTLGLTASPAVQEQRLQQ